MRILPPATHPWRKRIRRRHQPRPVSGEKGYREFLPCLRWEFGFSCAFCLCHEADLTRSGAQGLAIMQVEHYRLQSRSPAWRNRYSNCFLICRLCNLARHVAALRSAEGDVLLNPSRRAWSDAFELLGDEIQPRDPQDRDAFYTRDSYDLNDPRKVRMRRLRREVIERAWTFLQQSGPLVQKLLDRAHATGDPLLFEAAETIKNDRRNAHLDLQQFAAIPQDHDEVCRCDRSHVLPQALAEQTIEIGDEPGLPAIPSLPAAGR